MKLIVTIDTEEDNWAGYTESDFTAANIKQLSPLQALFDEYAVRPTYLTTYVVARDPQAVDLLGSFRSEGKCEIGAHCHPWNTPPVRETLSKFNSMLCNLPPELQFEKLQRLTETLEESFGHRPISFRAGRWGYSSAVGHNLVKLGYTVDSSISPYLDWSDRHGPDYSAIPLQPHWEDLSEIYPDSTPQPLVEIASTVGYLQRDFARSSRLHRLLLKQPLRSLKLSGILNVMGLLNRVWLCPELHSAEELIRLTRVLQEKEFPVVNLMFHSVTLQPGITPFVRTGEDADSFMRKIREYLDFAGGLGIESVTLSEAAEEVVASGNTHKVDN